MTPQAPLKSRDQVAVGDWYLGADGYAHRKRRYRRESRFPAKVQVGFDPVTLATIDRIADGLGIGRSTVIRQAVSDGLSAAENRLYSEVEAARGPLDYEPVT